MKSSKMTVDVKYFNLIRDIVGINEENIILDTGSTLRDLLACLEVMHGEHFSSYLFSHHETLRPYISIVRTGVSGHITIDCELYEHDELYIFVVLSGG
jgi:molybdopterin converting factor small subunit